MTGVSTLGQAISQVTRIRSQQTLMTKLATQMATGKIGQDFSELGSGVMLSQRARADIKSLDRYMNNITHADRRINVMMQAINEFKAQSENFSSALSTFMQEGTHQKGDIVYDSNDPDVAIGMSSAEPDVDFQTLVDLAEDLFDLLTDLINTQDEDRYVLSGSDTFTRPLDDTSLLDSSISSLLTDWKDGTIDTDALILAVKNKDTSVSSRALTDNIVGYSDALSAGNVGDVFVRADENAEIRYTARANEDPFRDVLVGLAVIKNANLTPVVDAYTPPNAPPAMPDANGAPGATSAEMQDNFYAFFNEINVMVDRAIDSVDQTRFRVETARARLDQFQKGHMESRNILLNTVSEAEDVDINEVAVRLNSLQIQIEASYMVTAENQQLSLVNFL